MKNRLNIRFLQKILRDVCSAAQESVLQQTVLERVEELVKAKVDVVVMDSAHGHSANVIRTVRMVKEKYPGSSGDRRKCGDRRGNKSPDRGRS